MEAKQVVFTAPNVAELQDFAFEADNLAPTEVAIRNRYSLISAGTELACLAGIESWASLPFVPGYCSVGEVMAVGAAVTHVKPGDRVLCYGKHASHVRVNRLVIPLPAGIDLRKACFARMAAVSMTSVRVGQPELGDDVAVTGLGLVGNLTAQLLRLNGCEVIGIDVEPGRLQTARACGITRTVNSRQQDVVEAVKALTAGRKCSLVVEATGLSAVAEQAASLAGIQGTVVLLGSPRAPYDINLTGFLRKIHLWGDGCITYKGAHEWRLPPARDPQGWAKHSIERNLEILVRLVADGRLHIDPLLTHVVPPERCAEAYAGVRDQKQTYVGVVFDWGEG